jgi:hypothetical protein
MAVRSGDTLQRQAPPSTLARCARLAAGVAVLLAVSEIIWLWQTWPLRELMQPVQLSAPAAPAR